MPKFDELIKDVKKIGITGHIRPDGDCVGSCLGLYNYIINKYPEKTVNVFLEEFSPKFDFLKNSEKIKKNFAEITEEEDVKHDLFFVLDVSTKDRIGEAAKLFDSSEKTICIDHHISNKNFSMHGFIETSSSSTCEVLFELFDEEFINKDVAECLYTGIIHDTGVLKYQSTSKRTMCIAGKLMEKGISFQNIIDDTFYSKTYNQNKVMAHAVLESILCLEGKCIYTILDEETLKKYNVTHVDLDGIVDQLRLTSGVECAVFVYQQSQEEYKVSLRAKNYMDVNKIADEFGGGGHIRAAGFTFKGNINAGIEKLLNLVSMQLR